MARQCNCFQKKLHHKVLLDAKREVMMCQVSTTTHLAMGRDQKLSGHNLPPPRSDRVKEGGEYPLVWDLAHVLRPNRPHYHPKAG